MLTDARIDLATLVAFGLVLARIAGVFIFVPIPGVSAAPVTARIVLTACCTLSLSSRWPTVSTTDLGFGSLTTLLAAEALFGMAIGIAVACILEVYTLGAQMLSLQAGFSYASTVNPETQADSTVLIVMAQFTAGLIFFALGLDHRVLIALARSLESHPPGTLVFSRTIGFDLIQLTAGIFSAGFRLVLPLMALLLMLDISLGLLSRLNSQLQVVTLSFPVKIGALLALLTVAVLLFPRAVGPFVETCLRFILRYS